MSKIKFVTLSILFLGIIVPQAAHAESFFGRILGQFLPSNNQLAATNASQGEAACNGFSWDNMRLAPDAQGSEMFVRYDKQLGMTIYGLEGITYYTVGENEERSLNAGYRITIKNGSDTASTPVKYNSSEIGLSSVPTSDIGADDNSSIYCSTLNSGNLTLTPKAKGGSIEKTAPAASRKITVAAWAKSDSAHTTWNEYGWITSYRDKSGFIIHPWPGTKRVSYYLYDDSATPKLTLLGEVVPQDITKWHHYALSYDGTTAAIYLDGVTQKTTKVNISRGKQGKAGSTIKIGKDDFGARYGSGTVGQVDLCNGVGTASDTNSVAAIYNRTKENYINTASSVTLPIRGKDEEVIPAGSPIHPITDLPNLRTGLVAEWEFDNTSGADSSGNNVTAKLNNATIASSALSLSGTNYASAQDTTSNLGITGDMTLSAWVNVKDFHTYRGLVSKSIGNLPNPYDWYLKTSSGVPTLYIGNGKSFGRIDANSAPTTGE
ncbi:MAG: LamG-like jellyroll fold domain-containing protein, partial [Candidatus Paceibacterota bacterium]